MSEPWIEAALTVVLEAGSKFPADLKSDRFTQLMETLGDGKPGAISVLCATGIRFGWVGLDLIAEEKLKGAALWDAYKSSGGTTEFARSLLLRNPLAIGALLFEHEFGFREVKL